MHPICRKAEEKRKKEKGQEEQEAWVKCEPLERRKREERKEGNVGKMVG